MLQDFPMYSYIPARDLARARQFYEGKLGFKPKEETKGGVVYEFAGGTACFLYVTPNAGTSQASQAFWDVDDVDDLIEQLKAKGVKFSTPIIDDPNMMGGVRIAFFTGASGEVFELFEYLKPVPCLHDNKAVKQK